MHVSTATLPVLPPTSTATDNARNSNLLKLPDELLKSIPTHLPRTDPAQRNFGMVSRRIHGPGYTARLTWRVMTRAKNIQHMDQATRLDKFNEIFEELDAKGSNLISEDWSDILAASAASIRHLPENEQLDSFHGIVGRMNDKVRSEQLKTKVIAELTAIIQYLPVDDMHGAFNTIFDQANDRSDSFKAAVLCSAARHTLPRAFTPDFTHGEPLPQDALLAVFNRIADEADTLAHEYRPLVTLLLGGSIKAIHEQQAAAATRFLGMVRTLNAEDAVPPIVNLSAELIYFSPAVQANVAAEICTIAEGLPPDNKQEARTHLLARVDEWPDVLPFKQDTRDRIDRLAPPVVEP